MNIFKHLLGLVRKDEITVCWWFNNGWTSKSSYETYKVPYYVKDKDIIINEQQLVDRKNSVILSSIKRNNFTIYKHPMYN